MNVLNNPNLLTINFSNKKLTGINMLTNNYEDLWVDVWTDLNFLVDEHKITEMLLADHTKMSLIEAKQWIQDAAKNNERVLFSLTFYNNKDYILMSKEKV